jgi:hypothetical protein
VWAIFMTKWLEQPFFHPLIPIAIASDIGLTKYIKYIGKYWEILGNAKLFLIDE